MDSMTKKIESLKPELIQWRHHLHAHPETAFEEVQTAKFVAEKLRSFGLDVHQGLAKTGVVATLTKGDDSVERTIGLRADMDALDIREKTNVAYRSVNSGKMHACGHDGHMTMLLGAAKLLAEEELFKGSVRFIFQPAEENEGGGGVMVAEGLFDKFPLRSIYGMHNFPTIPMGTFAIRPGPMMAAYDVFDITVNGLGGHAAMPHLTKDPIVAASSIVNELQTLVSRNTPPLEAAVLSVTEIHGGTAYNIIPDRVEIRGTTRHFKAEIEQMLESRISEVVNGIATATGTNVDLRYRNRYPALVNTEAETQIAVEAALETVGKGKVDADLQPIMGSEDFAFMLQTVPGAYIGIGSGSLNRTLNLHQATYDFNDEVLPIGVAYWIKLVRRLLAE